MSWAESHKEAKSGIYTLSFYDEAGYAAYRKVSFCLFLMCYNVIEASAVCDDYFDLSIQ